MKLLIISPFYSPYSLVGANRMISLSVYLADHGHDVTVLSYDYDTLKRIVGVENLQSVPPTNVRLLHFPFHSPKLKWKILYPINGYLGIKSWERGLGKLLDGENFEAVLLTCGPTDTQMAVAKYIRHTHIPLILDIRDLNVLSNKPHDSNRVLRFIRGAIWKRQEYIPEKRCMEIATKVVVVVSGMVDELKHAYGIDEAQTELIYNGFDDAVLKSIPTTTKTENCYCIGYFGKMMYYSPPRCEMLLRALHRLRQDGYAVELVHIGPGGDDIQSEIGKLGLSQEIYRPLGGMDYRMGMSHLQTMDCFAIEYVDPIGLGTKVFDYIFCNKPIVCVTPCDTALSKFVARFENGFSCDSEEDTYNAIKQIMRSKLDVLDRNIDISTYSRSEQNIKYELLLHKIVDNASR